MSHKRVIRTEPFWRKPKELNPNHKDYRRTSEDLPLLPEEWRFNQLAYEIDLELLRKSEKNIAKLEKDIHPNQQ